ncbi:MAG: two pore domain potassium channel family protein [Deltaproteobacteria bacterium]|nr:two pore domain potassium channel family protein [Deltaproteobacteria bacterium]
MPHSLNTGGPFRIGPASCPHHTLSSIPLQAGRTSVDALKFRLRIFMVVFCLIMLLGTLGFMFSDGLSPVDAFYFTLVTVTTVGYGDIHPVTPLGKIFAILLIVSGVGTFLGVVANTTEILLNRRESRIRLQKLHMVTGLFFSEVGTRLLEMFCGFDPRRGDLEKDLLITPAWDRKEFSGMKESLGSYGFGVEIHRGDLEGLRRFLDEKGAFLLRLLENPVLLEQEHLTELLRAIFHLREELLHRDDLKDLPDTDYAHLAGDIRRAYGFLVREWLQYMEYLKGHYPYLFSLAARTNPFNPDRSAVVR